MGEATVPIRNAPERRLPQAGRIRIGRKDTTIKAGRRAIDTFRLTSQERKLLEPVAETYGGEVRPWHDAKSPDRFEVITKTRSMSVVLPPNPLSEWYELWTGDEGLKRRCDDEVCDMKVASPDGYDMEQVPCICRRKGVRECRYKLRLSVMLPEVASIGTWRLDTGSENARAEIPAMVDVIGQATGRGLVKAVLRLEQRTSPGKRFNVPVLDIEATIGSLVAGDQRLAALPAPESHPPALGPGTGDDEIIEAELVHDSFTGPQPIEPMFGREFLNSLTKHQRVKALNRGRELALELGEPMPMDIAGLTPLIIDHLIQEMDV